MKAFLCCLLLIHGLSWLSSCHGGSASTFSPDYFGVLFHPSVLQSVERGQLDFQLGNMVATIGTQFRKILMPSVDLKNQPHAKLPNAVAKYNKANRNRGNTLELVMMCRVELSFRRGSGFVKSTDFHLVKQLADEANSIFPGTVRLLLFDLVNLNVSTLTAAQTQLNQFASELSSSPGFRYKVGAHLSYNLCTESTLMANIVPLLDVVIFQYSLSTAEGGGPLTVGVNPNLDDLTRCKALVENIPLLPFPYQFRKADVHVGYLLFWWGRRDGGKGSSDQDLIHLWKGMSKWASRSRTSVIMVQGIGTEGGGGRGWWTFKKGTLVPRDVDVEENFVIADRGSMTPPPPPATHHSTIVPTIIHHPAGNNSNSSSVSVGVVASSDKLETSSSSSSNFEQTVKEGMTLLVIIVGGVGAVMVILCGLIGSVAVIKFMKRGREYNSRPLSVLTAEDIKVFYSGGVPLFPDCPMREATGSKYNTELECQPSSFTIDESCVLGSGAFGMVYRGTLRKWGVEHHVAVKTAKTPAPATTLKGLLSEIKVLSHVGRHESIVAILGAYTSELKKGKVFVFTEFCERGDLLQNLRKMKWERRSAFGGSSPDTVAQKQKSGENYRTNLVCPPEATAAHATPPELLVWAHEIVCGMEFLASKNVVHADLAARNILLTNERRAKISDFGLSRRIYEYTSYVKTQEEPLPWKWMSPESLTEMVFNEKSDVWAFGVTFWEILSLGDVPYPGLSWTVDFSNRLEQGLRLGKARYDDIGTWHELMLKCWDMDPQLRPSFSELRALLQFQEKRS